LRKLRSKRVVGSVLVLGLALFLVRPQVGRLHKKVAESLSWQLGRRVSIDSVHIRFLPRPGLELENLAIYDSAEFGAEPALRSPDVTAWLRVSSLLRRRIEISSLSLSDASVNLCRNPDGKWNIEELVERASKSSTAPTASSRKEPRREFPYIEADHARINFKDGLEKTHFALTNAEFALWQESEDEWGLRLRARPIRTDANLTDTGTVSVSGTWGRSVELKNTPIQLSLEWKQAQIGQVSQLFSGSDQGWRGSVLVDASISGTLGNSVISSDLSADQLRRRDILANGDLRAIVHCAAEYDSAQRALINVDCSAPAGDGTVELKGTTAGIPFSSYDLTLSAKDVPAESALHLARRAHQYIPDDLQTTGTINAELSLVRSRPDSSPQLSGEGELSGLRVGSANSEFPIGMVPIQLVTSARKLRRSESSNLLGSSQLEIGPFSASLGRPTPIQTEISVSRAGYHGSIRGEAALKRLLQAAHMLRIAVPAVNADGVATLNLALSHNWGETAPAITGRAQLHAIRAQVRGLNSPLQIHHAELSIAPDAVHVTNLEASVGATAWRGSLLIPRPCSAPESCEFQFHLRSPQLTAAEVNQMFNPEAVKRPWYRLLTPETANSFFMKTGATGSIEIDKLLLGHTACNRFSADLELRKGQISLTKIHGILLGGKTAGTLKADFSVRTPAYSGSGTFDSISLAAVAGLMHNAWVDGTGSADYKFKAAGWKLQEILDSVELTSTFEIQDGAFPHVVLAEGTEPLLANSFTGNMKISGGNFSFADAKLQSQRGVYMISGTASLTGTLNLKMTGESSTGYTLSGTLAQTRVSPITIPPTQAELKP